METQLTRPPRQLHWEEAVRNALVARQQFANNVTQMLALLAVFLPEPQEPSPKKETRLPRWPSGGNDFY